MASYDGALYKLYSNVHKLTTYLLSPIAIFVIILMTITGYYINYWNIQVFDYNFSYFAKTVHLYQNNSFVENWNRLMSARTDWHSVLSPCTNNTEYRYNNTLPGWGEQNKTSAKKSIVNLMDGRKAGEFSTIWIQTRTEDGRAKTIGGDYWRIIFTGPANIAATVFDHRNGTYEAIALLMEPGVYNIQIFLEYTLCKGLTDPPDHWFRAGNAQGKYQPPGTIRTNDAKYYHEALQGDFSVNISKNPTTTDINKRVAKCTKTCNLIQHGHGRWVDDKWLPFSIVDPITRNESTPNQTGGGSGSLLVFGDSLALRFGSSISRQRWCTQHFSRCTYAYNWIYPLTSEQDGKRINDDFDFRPSLVLESIRNVLRRTDMTSNNSLLVINLGLHYVMGVQFKAFQLLIYDIIALLKSRQKTLGSSAGVVWKSTSFMHKEKGKDMEIHNRFFSPHRVLLFDRFAVSEMCKAGIDVLDVYHLTDSYLPGTVGENDLVHYKDNVFHHAEMELQRFSSPKFGKRRNKICTNIVN